MKKIIILLSILFSVPVMANEKVLFCEEYKNHLLKMKQMQTQQNFSYKSKAWKTAEDDKKILIETGNLHFGDNVRITQVCSGLLNMMKSKQFKTFR